MAGWRRRSGFVELQFQERDWTQVHDSAVDAEVPIGRLAHLRPLWPIDGKPQARARFGRLVEVEFPVPDESSTLRRSIAERDRILVLVLSVASLLPVAIVLGPLFESPLTRLLVTFVVCMAFATALALFFRSRFVSSFSSARLHVRPTGRSLSSRAQRNADDLSESGFGLSNVVAITDGDERVFTRPLALFERVNDHQVAICSELGVQMVSQFGDDALFVTASHEVVGHKSILVQSEPDATASEVAASHGATLAQIRSNFHIEPVLIDPVTALLQVERREQQTLVDAKGFGTLHRSLVAAGDPVGDEEVRGWLAEQSLLRA